ncbi:hypothetical protein BC939DRAFT_449868 [Gamsiella multidivaricata]|uniref:uncharacterized protein n=1 Tax=Gamsiella multidivaricata TaxID=101098 RepID=UPI0022210EF6|nr:uncharacterized protein BC939DRAFT_449868 [Gamsiella multidivaricata]KAG0367342.1 hypothetical protein BGZ54_004005 [Gamsiella multidivaricata]KAI7824724.1 hypothetical protein BC939DRAFT_449868 [Gamsiella multidivaricata]
MNQPIVQGALPILSNVLGNNTVAGLMAVINMALNTVTSATAAVNGYNSYSGERTYFGQKQGDNQGQHFESAFMSALSMVFSAINSTFASLTASQTPLTTYILLALLSYVAFRIVYGIVSWVVRSVLNLIKISIIITVITSIIWFVINVTSGGEGGTGSDAYGTGQQRQHQDPISQVLHSLQSKFKAEFERQRQYLQNPHVY